MKNDKKKLITFLAVLTVMIMALSVSPLAATYTMKSKTIYKGKTYTLSIKGKKNVKWKSSNTKVATISYTSGKLVARKTGKTTITGTVGKNKYKCSVTIKNKTEANTKTDTDTKKEETPKAGESATARKFLNYLQAMSDRVRSDAKAGRTWYYANPTELNDFYKEAEIAAKGGAAHSRCSHIVRWGLTAVGVTPAGAFIYANTSGNGKVVYNKKASNSASFKSKITVIDAYKTPNELLKEGNLLPGDICIWCMDHISVYAGDNTWFDAGRGTDGSWKNGKFYFNSFGPIKGWMSSKVGQIVRLK